MRFVVAACLASAALGDSYNEQRAIEFAKIAHAAYCSKSSLESWSCGYRCAADVSSVSVCTGKSTQAFVGLWEHKCIVSFEGTHDVNSWITDLQFFHGSTHWAECEGCEIHSGFRNEYDSLKDCVKAQLNAKGCAVGSSIRTTGHSLGAALNGLAMMDLHYDGWRIAESYDFGKPRVGDEDFAKEFNSFFGDVAWRVTHHRDPVPHLPPSDLVGIDFHYESVEPEAFYKGHVSEGVEKCWDANQDKHCSEKYWNVPYDLFYVNDHLTYMDVMGDDDCVGGLSDSVYQRAVLV